MNTDNMDDIQVKNLARERLNITSLRELYLKHYTYRDLLEELPTLELYDYLSNNLIDIKKILLDLAVELFETHKLSISEKEEFLNKIKEYLK